jgi:hypothetical protein
MSAHEHFEKMDAIVGGTAVGVPSSDLFGGVTHSEVESLKHLLRSKDRQIHELQNRADAAATILHHAIIAKRPRFRREVGKAYDVLCGHSSLPNT